jgi:hypothetical protein
MNEKWYIRKWTSFGNDKLNDDKPSITTPSYNIPYSMDHVIVTISTSIIGIT